MWQRRLRLWIWRGNVGLACVALVVAVRALTYEPPSADIQHLVPALVFPESWQFQGPISRAEFNAHMENVRRFHGRERTPEELKAAEPVFTEPPLRAYRVLLYIKDPGGLHSVTLTCKDPAHPRTYRPRIGHPHDGVSLDSGLFGAEFATFDVSRGEEYFAFRVPLRLGGGGRGIHSIGNTQDPRGTPAKDGGSRDTLAPLPIRSAKFVAYQDARGNAAGVRITGVKPGTWLAELGLKPGDVITSWDGADVRHVQKLFRLSEAQVYPRRVVVMRGVATRSVRQRTLRRS